MHLQANQCQKRKQQAQARGGVGGRLECDVQGLADLHRAVFNFLPAAVLPLFQRQQGAPHQAGLGALQALAPPVEVGEIVNLPFNESFARAKGIPKLLLQGFEPCRVFAQGPHHFVVILGVGALAVSNGVHSGMLFSGRAARTGRAPGIRACGVEQLRSKLR